MKTSIGTLPPRVRAARLVSAALALLSVPAAAPGLASDTVSLDNGRLALRFDAGTGSLLEFSDPATSRSLNGPGARTRGIWQLTLREPGTTRTRTLSPDKATSVGVSREGDTVRLRWTLPSPDPAVEVTVALPENSPDSRWSIRVGELQNTELAEVRFPRIHDLTPLPDERVAVPLWMGQETSAARRLVNGAGGRAQRQEWSYPGLLSLQCVAVTGGKGSPGVYFASNDTGAWHKSFALFGDGRGGMSLEQTHLPEQAGEGSWSMPYESIVGVLHGDWFTAAERYRTWADRQSWVRDSRKRRGLVPEWLKKRDLWVWNRGRSEEVLAPAVALSERLGLPVGVFWHWWHACAYDIDFPEYFPPREGTESFTAALDEAHRRGVQAIVYMNQRLWGMTTPSWNERGVERHAVKRPDGRVQPEIYNVFTSAPCAAMCMSTPFWRDTYAGLAERARLELGVDGIYMDQACSSLACYDPAHGHPPGGGRYWMEGFRRLEADIRRRAGTTSGPVVLAGEGVAECWLPHLDLMLSLEVSRERYTGVGDWEVIPFFHAVYHADALIYGNYSSLAVPPYDEKWPRESAPEHPGALLDRRYSQQFALEQARSFVWGQQLTVANYRDSQWEERREELEFVVRLARLRSAGAAWLRDGTLLRPPALSADDEAATTIPVSRLSIYAGRTPQAVRHYEKSVAQVLAAAWRSPSGRTAVALASIASHELSVELPVHADAWQLRAPMRVIRVDESGEQEIGLWEGGEHPVPITLPARGACLVEFRP